MDNDTEKIGCSVYLCLFLIASGCPRSLLGLLDLAALLSALNVRSACRAPLSGYSLPVLRAVGQGPTPSKPEKAGSPRPYHVPTCPSRGSSPHTAVQPSRFGLPFTASLAKRFYNCLTVRCYLGSNGIDVAADSLYSVPLSA